MVIRECKNCDFYDGFINFRCSGCNVFQNAIKKTKGFKREMESEPTLDEINHFKQLWSEI